MEFLFTLQAEFLQIASVNAGGKNCGKFYGCDRAE
jgi:hypothetical protein